MAESSTVLSFHTVAVFPIKVGTLMYNISVVSIDDYVDDDSLN